MVYKTGETISVVALSTRDKNFGIECGDIGAFIRYPFPNTQHFVDIKLFKELPQSPVKTWRMTGPNADGTYRMLNFQIELAKSFSQKIKIEHAGHESIVRHYDDRGNLLSSAVAHDHKGSNLVLNKKPSIHNSLISGPKEKERHFFKFCSTPEEFNTKEIKDSSAARTKRRIVYEVGDTIRFRKDIDSRYPGYPVIYLAGKTGQIIDKRSVEYADCQGYIYFIKSGTLEFWFHPDCFEGIVIGQNAMPPIGIHPTGQPALKGDFVRILPRTIGILGEYAGQILRVSEVRENMAILKPYLYTSTPPDYDIIASPYEYEVLFSHQRNKIQ